MNIKKLTDKAILPTQGTPGAAGYDLFTVEAYELKPGERKSFKTDLCLQIPHGLYGRIAGRSGLALKKGIEVLGGVIDSDYIGEIRVILINLGQDVVQIKEGDKIAQIIFEAYSRHGFTEVDKLTDTQRGANGFGSTDINPSTETSPSTILLDSIGSSKSVYTAQRRYEDLIRNREKI
jgi:dUTP pyrophosphatase